MKFSEKEPIMEFMQKDLLDHLNELRARMQRSGLERTSGLKQAMSDNCAYYRKSKDLLLKEDFDQIKDLFLICLEEYRKIEGNNFGR